MVIRQLVKEGVKGKFVCLPVLRGWQSLSPVLCLPPAIAGTEKLLHKGWSFSFQQCMCITRPWDYFSGVGELILCVHLYFWPWRGLEVESGAAGARVKPSNYPSVFVELCL